MHASPRFIVSVFSLLVPAFLAAPKTSARQETEPHRLETNGIVAYIPERSRFVAANETGVSESWIFLENTTTRAQDLTVEIQLDEPIAKTSSATRSLPISLPPGETRRAAIIDPNTPLSEIRFGLRGIRFRLVQKTAETATQPTGHWASDVVAIYPPNPQPRRGESIMPIGFATGAALATPRLHELAATLGFEYYRFNAIWSEVQSKPDVWNWERLDEKLALLRRHNFRWHITTTGSPPWISPERFALPPPPPLARVDHRTRLALQGRHPALGNLERTQHQFRLWNGWALRRSPARRL